jgi:hypothetical protein
MKDIGEMEVTQFRLFAPGRIPYKQICTQHGLERIQQAFAFRETAALPGNIELLFEGGSLAHPERAQVGVNRLQISERRVAIAASGDSPAADQIFEALKKILIALDPSDLFIKSKPVSVRQETTCVATLAFGWEDLFSPSVSKFLHGAFPRAASDKEAEIRLNSVRLRFGFTYEIKDEAISQYGITLAPKSFVIEPQKDTPLSERRYFTGSPTDSKTHLSLVSDFEKLFA